MTGKIAALALVGFAFTAFGAETVGLKTCRLASPANVVSPVFSWKMASDEPGAAQTAYRVRVWKGLAREPAALAWDSGKVAGALSHAVPYAGAPLASAAKYCWEVTVTDEKGRDLKPALGFFETGLTKAEDWAGSAWIAVAGPVPPRPKAGRSVPGTSCFVKTVPNGKEVKEAYWTVTGLGAFEAYVNGRPVSRKGCRAVGGRLFRDFLKPGFTHWAKCRHAFTYDVTHLMKTGAADANAFAAQVSSGWWRDQINGRHGRESAFRAMLVLRFADGTERRVGTDTTWLAAVAGPVKLASIFEGEDFDARVKTPWMTGAADPAFAPAKENFEFKGEIRPMVGGTIRLRDDLALAPVEIYAWKGVDGATATRYGKVRRIRTVKPGEPFALAPGENAVIDFGQNAAAVPRFTAAAAAGVTLTLTPAEFLNDGNGEKSRGNDGPAGSVYRANMRAARARANYTFAGEGEETWHPEFTFFGYRYLSLAADGAVRVTAIASVPVTSVGPGTETATIETSDPSLNRLAKNGLWGQYSNYLSVPTDCPQRDERLGWMADTQVFAKTGCYNADVYGFLSKFMDDVADSQHPDGGLPGVAPFAQYGNDCGVGWADAGIIVPFRLWRAYGDRTVLDRNWAMMKRYMDRIDRTRGPNASPWGDWLAYERNDKLLMRYLARCFWVWDNRMMAEMAAALGKADDAARFAKTGAAAERAFRREFLDAEGCVDRRYACQCAYLYALHLDLVKGEAREDAIRELVANVRRHGDKLQTGFLGTAIIMDTLVEIGRADLAYTLLLQRGNPSWLYSIDQGATTFWERWNSYTKDKGFGDAGMNSFNHYAYGAVLGWMYGAMGGVREDPAHPGYKHFFLSPSPDPRVREVKMAFESPYGRIASAWKYGADGDWTWTFTIPANASATVTVPGRAPAEYAAGTHAVTVAR